MPSWLAVIAPYKVGLVDELKSEAKDGIFTAHSSWTVSHIVHWFGSNCLDYSFAGRFPILINSLRNLYQIFMPIFMTAW